MLPWVVFPEKYTMKTDYHWGQPCQLWHEFANIMLVQRRTTCCLHWHTDVCAQGVKYLQSLSNSTESAEKVLYFALTSFLGYINQTSSTSWLSQPRVTNTDLTCCSVSFLRLDITGWWCSLQIDEIACNPSQLIIGWRWQDPSRTRMHEPIQASHSGPLELPSLNPQDLDRP